MDDRAGMRTLGPAMTDKSDWSTDGRNILSEDRLATLRKILDDVGPVIVEHWFYYGSRSPDRLVFDDYYTLVEYLKGKTKPGDAIHVWNYAELCRDSNTLVNGKIPDEQGRTPKGGAY
jgi:hypothetical protein